MFHFYNIVPRMYSMDELFYTSHGSFNYSEIESARRKNRRAKVVKRSRHS